MGIARESTAEETGRQEASVSHPLAWVWCAGPIATRAHDEATGKAGDVLEEARP